MSLTTRVISVENLAISCKDVTMLTCFIPFFFHVSFLIDKQLEIHKLMNKALWDFTIIFKTVKEVLNTTKFKNCCFSGSKHLERAVNSEFIL